MNATQTDRVRLDAVVRGRVQGVGFRYFVLREAITLGLEGWVANEPDGSVRCVAEGDRLALEALLEDHHRGPAGSRVDAVGVSWAAPAGDLPAFTVRASAHRGD